MQVVPAIDLLDGKCVQLIEGKPDDKEVSIDDVVGTALGWQELGAERLHLIDLDATLGRGDNFAVIDELLRSLRIPVQVGGGIRDDAKAERLISSGASQIIVGTRAVTDADWLRSISDRFPDRVIVAVDARGSKISIKGWTGLSGIDLYEYVASIRDLPLFGLLYTNILKEGRLSGIDIRPIEKLMTITDMRLFVAGGISSISDIERIESTGAYGAVLGMSIYKGKINLREALERFK